MAYQPILSDTERTGLLSLPDNQDDLIRYYTFNETDLSLIRQRRGDSNRIGFAVQLALFRYPGTALSDELDITDPVLHWIGQQIGVDPREWPNYALRDKTRREHYQELRTYLRLETFGITHFRYMVSSMTDLAMQTDKGLMLASHMIDILREKRIILPSLDVIERICVKAIINANRRIRDLKEIKLYVPDYNKKYEALNTMIGGKINIKSIRSHWDEVLRLASSIKQGTVTASLMIRKLGSYPRQNGLAFALRELGRIERTLFILDWLQSVELRKRVHAGLNKGEARNALARAVFFNRLGEIRDRSFEQQRYRASGLNLVTAAIVLWNTVYLERATNSIMDNGDIDIDLLQYLSPLGWEHINLTGDYIWPHGRNPEKGAFRPLRTIEKP